MLLYLHSQTRKHQHMPRQERTKSGTGIYHVMLRGINKQDIFEDDEDYLQMTSIKTKMITVPWSFKSAVKSIGIEGEINSKVQLVNPSNNRVYLEKKFTTPAGVHNLVKGSKNVITIKKLPVMNGNPNFQFRYEEPSGISRIMLEKRINKL